VSGDCAAWRKGDSERCYQCFLIAEEEEEEEEE